MAKVVLFYGIPEPDKDYYWAPTNQLFLAATLMEKGHEVVIIDEQAEPSYGENLVAEAKDAIMVGFSAFTGFQIESCLKAARLLREHYPKLKLVWGGSHPSALPEQTLANENVDVVVIGSGEVTLVEIADALLAEKPLDSVKGIALEREGKPVITEPRDFFDINSTPKLPLHMLKWEKYINPKTKVLNYTSSSGCRNWCTFCYWSCKHSWKGFPPERTLNDLQYLVDNYDIKFIRFLDSDFFTDKERALAISKGMMERNFNKLWVANARVDVLAEYENKDWKVCAESGLRSIFIGLESGSQKILKLMNKNIDLDDMVKATKHLNGTPIKIYLSLMFGIPTETIEDIKQTREFIDRLREANKNIWHQTCIFEPLPGTPLTMLAAKHGYPLPDSLEGWARYGDRKTRFRGKPWFSEEYNRKYEKCFNKLFPKNDYYITQLTD